MLSDDQVRDVFDKDVYGSDGERIGSAEQVYTDDQTGQPEWLTVKTGLFGSRENFVPLAGADLTGDRVVVPFTKAVVKDAPNVDADGHLSPEEEQRLYDYYGLDDTQASVVPGDDDRAGVAGTTEDAATVGRTESTGDRSGDGRRTEGHDVSGPTTDDAMTVSEERLSVGTERRETGRVRLRKYVVTENVTQTVPVQREEVRLEREPISDANAGDALDGPAISEEEHEVVLHEEQPVVQKEAVPVERVRLGTETVTEQQTVGDEVRKERVEVDGDGDTPTADPRS